MKLLSVTVLAVFLFQGGSAQFGGLRNLASNARIGAKTVENAAFGAASNASNATSNIRSFLSRGAQALFDSASTDVSVDSLAEAARNLTPKELLETVQAAAAEVNARARAILIRLDDTVRSVTRKAEASLSSAFNAWNRPVEAVVQKAVSAGVNVRDCAVDDVANLAKDSVTSVVNCVTHRLQRAFALAKNVAGLPIRAASLVKEGAAGYRTCRGKSGAARRTCRATEVDAVAVQSVLLLRDAASYTTQCAASCATITARMAACAAAVATKSAAEAVSVGAKIVSCVSGKLSGNTAGTEN